MTDLSHWQPDGWRTPSTVALAMPAGMPAHGDAVDALREAGVALVQAPLHEAAGTPAAVADADVLISGGIPVDAAAVRGLRRVRLLLRPYIGYDDIDLDAATDRGILVANVPDTVPEDVANHTMALILAGNRKLLAMDRLVRDGLWTSGGRARAVARVAPIQRLSDATLGLVGLGGIGRLVAERARVFGFRLLAHDPFVGHEQAGSLGVALVPLEDLLAESDIVSLHVFLSPETRGLIGAEQLAHMKHGAYLVNTSRGALVDEAALIDALQAGKLAGAALDVFQEEPVAADNPLLTMEAVLLSPHLANYSVGGLRQLWLRAAEIALQVAAGGLPERKVVINKTLYDRLASLPELAHLPRA